VKLTLAVQLAPAANVAQLCVTAKWIDAESELTETGLAPAFASVSESGGAVVPIDWPPKDNDAGFGTRLPGAADVVLWKTAETPPTVSVVDVAVVNDEEAVCWTQIVWPLSIVPAAEVKPAPQPIEYCPPVTVTGVAVLIPVIVTVLEVTSEPGATLACARNENASGTVSGGCVSPTMTFPTWTQLGRHDPPHSSTRNAWNTSDPVPAAGGLKVKDCCAFESGLVCVRDH
jgi:hypothetical protein